MLLGLMISLSHELGYFSNRRHSVAISCGHTRKLYPDVQKAMKALDMLQIM
jgi:hypothetical protein